MEVGIGAMRPQAKKYQALLTVTETRRESWNGFYPRAFGRGVTLLTL